jgi:hypothetical protein
MTEELITNLYMSNFALLLFGSIMVPIGMVTEQEWLETLSKGAQLIALILFFVITVIAIWT